MSNDVETGGDGMHMGDGLWNVRAFTFLILWYLFSGCTLFLNKYIMTTLHGDPTFLGTYLVLLYFLISALVVSYVYYFLQYMVRVEYIKLFFSRGDFIGTCQMLMTLTCGFIQMYFPCGMYRQVTRYSRPPGFYRHMILVGTMR